MPPSKSPEFKSTFPPASYADWRKMAERLLDGKPFESLMSVTYEDIEIEPIYDPERYDSSSVPAAGSLMSPSGANWEIAQELPFSSPEDFNRILLADLASGQTAVSLRVARIWQAEPKFADAAAGTAIRNYANFEAALAGVDLQQHHVYIDAGLTAPVFWAFLLELCDRQNVSLHKMRGSIEFDPFKDQAKYGDPQPSPRFLQLNANTIAWANENAPAMNSVGVDVNAYHNAGADAVQELAFALATAVDYIRLLLQASPSLKPESLNGKIRFSFGVGSDFFLEIAKLRAIRQIWPQVITAFGVHDPHPVCIHARCSERTRAHYDRHNNILRTTGQAMAAALGSCDSMHIPAFDAVHVPDNFSRRISRNIQLILKLETLLTKVTDPAAGSWYVETLTRQLAERAWTLFQSIEKQGGMQRALRDGTIQQAIVQTVQKRRTRIATREEKLVGVSIHADRLQKSAGKVDPSQIQALANAAPHQPTTARSLELLSQLRTVNLQKNAKTGQYLDLIAEASSHGVSLPEIVNAIEGPTEQEVQVEAVNPYRDAEPFEQLRDRAATIHPVPHVFLVNFGKPAQHRACNSFATDFFQIGGFTVTSSPAFSSAQEAVHAARASAAPVITICATNEIYAEMVPDFVPAIKAEDSETIVILAGYPKQHAEAFMKAGVDNFIYNKCDALQLLNDLLTKISDRQ